MKTLLVVDDDESIRLLLRDEFCDNGYNVVTAVDGEEGLVAFNEQHIDVVVLDLNMPKLTGEQVAAKLKRKAPQVPVVIYTANPERLEKQEIAYDSLVYKSSDLEELVAKVTHLANV
ncbi:response regulator receiver protein [Denitrovibrio acetiphilus DSM 12809]|uniref:Response regulator receiver protein n=1 Tax=Denitrovibrio acetiphilus (strain DSM 12809 / NBRC 114555 / N2460) TaxID=522772 RepID=D4H7L1_DENA2|nr:response regulator [Denitrovibrio acetiphilus]ADD68010.1 response regulator receiver protein [Denitrovibrio acetiphilus DSM 12809]